MKVKCKRCGRIVRKNTHYCYLCHRFLRKRGLRYCSGCLRVKRIGKFSGNSRSCKKCTVKRGQRWYLKNSPYWRISLAAATRLNNRNREKGFRDRITKAQLRCWWKETANRCYYCGISSKKLQRIRSFIRKYSGRDYGINKFKFLLLWQKQKKLFGLTVDRRINSVGYVPSNMVKACWICNSIKGRCLLPSDMEIIAPRIMKRLIKRIKVAGGKI